MTEQIEQQFQLPGGDGPEPCPPGWESVFEDHYRKRRILRDQLDRGYFPFQAVQAAGLDRPACHEDWPENLKDQIAARDKRVTQLEQLLAAKDREIVKLRDERDELKAQVALWMRRASGAQRR